MWIKGINGNSTTAAFSTHDPFFLAKIKNQVSKKHNIIKMFYIDPFPTTLSQIWVCRMLKVIYAKF